MDQKAQPVSDDFDAWTFAPPIDEPNVPVSIVPATSPTLDESPNLTSLTAAQLPDPRVRFSAPAELRLDGLDEAVEGAVLNISRGGVAIAADCELTPGQRFWARFRLGFTDEANDYLCAVAWRQNGPDRHVLYGCEFSSLTEQEEQALGRVIEARTEGTDAEWSLPPVAAVETPEEDPIPAQPSTRSMWFFGAFGGLGLAVATFWLLGAFAPAESTVGSFEPVEGPSTRIRVGPSDETPDASSGEPEAVALSGAAATGSSSDESQSNETPSGAAQPSPDTGVSLQTTATGVAVELLADGPIEEHTSFWLENPRRFVVDVANRGSGFEQNRYVLDHPLVGKLRVGRHPDKVRFVLDVSDSVERSAEAEIDGARIRIKLIAD